MFCFSRKRTSAGWPFWLLIAAWFCANSPQLAVYEIVAWAGNARHFSHQQRLRAEVESLLGKNTSQSSALAKGAPEKPFDLPVPVDATLKKSSSQCIAPASFCRPPRERFGGLKAHHCCWTRFATLPRMSRRVRGS